MNDTVEDTMSCRKVRKQLVAYLDGELGPSETDQITDHLADCPSCADAQERLLDSTPVAPALAIDDAVLHRFQLQVLERLDEEPLPEPRAVRPSLRGLVQEVLTADVRVPRGLVVLYAAALLAVLGWAASRTGGPTPQPVAVQDTAEEVGPTAMESHQPAAYTPQDGWF